MSRPRWALASILLLAGPAAADDTLDRLDRLGDAGFDIRYRHESVDEKGGTQDAGANTVRLRANFASAEMRGFSGFLELDHVEALGDQRYNDTRNGETGYPVVADPQGTDLNQGWLQYKLSSDALLRLGRQRINHGNHRFVGASDWRQNEQTFDALRIETTALSGLAVDYAYVDEVRRVFGPEDGVPAATLESASHLLNLKLTSLPAGTAIAYGYLLDFQNAPALSSRTVGLRYEGSKSTGGSWSISWAVEYARQRDAAENPVPIDADYRLVELRLADSNIQLFTGEEILSGEPGLHSPADNPAFQTPIATLHKFQGWADLFTTTPAAGIEDWYAGVAAAHRGWTAQAVWHEFTAESGDSRYGSELDASITVKLSAKLDFLVKLADFRGDEGFADTRKLWLQLHATF